MELRSLALPFLSPKGVIRKRNNNTSSAIAYLQCASHGALLILLTLDRCQYSPYFTDKEKIRELK
jgi:hypothetical protein